MCYEVQFVVFTPIVVRCKAKSKNVGVGRCKPPFRRSPGGRTHDDHSFDAQFIPISAYHYILCYFIPLSQPCTAVTSTLAPNNQRWIQEIRRRSFHLLNVRPGAICHCGSATPSIHGQQGSQIFDHSLVRSQQRPHDWDKKGSDQLRIHARIFPLNSHGYTYASLDQDDKRRETLVGGRVPRPRTQSFPQPHPR